MCVHHMMVMAAHRSMLTSQVLVSIASKRYDFSACQMNDILPLITWHYGNCQKNFLHNCCCPNVELYP